MASADISPERVERLQARRPGMAPEFAAHHRLVGDPIELQRPPLAAMRDVAFERTRPTRSRVITGLDDSKKLTPAQRAALAPVIKAEMKNFQATISPSGHETMAARTGTHDDLLQALSLAMHHSLVYHRGDPCRQIPYQEFEPAPLVPGTAPKVFGLDPDMGPAEELPVAPDEPGAVFGPYGERLDPN